MKIKNDAHCWQCGKIINDNGKALKCRRCAHLGIKFSDEHIENIRKALLGNTCRKGTKTNKKGKENIKEGAIKGLANMTPEQKQVWKEKLSKAQLGNHNGLGYKFRTEQKENMSKARLNYMQEHPENIFSSSWETKFIQKVLIKKLGYEISDIEQQKFVCEHPFDIFVKSKNMLIEIDGNWCHKGEGKFDNVKKDRQDSLNAIKHGYSVTRFDDNDLRVLGII